MDGLALCLLLTGTRVKFCVKICVKILPDDPA
mgnify:CR=1 FL=1